MKKIIIALMVFVLSACSFSATTTPKQKVSEFLDKYKNEHTNVIEQLKDTIESEFSGNDEYKKRYETLMKNQYKNLEYEIKDEVIEDNTAVVDVEVTVLNYGESIKNSSKYLNDHKDEFIKSSKDKATIDEDDDDNNDGLIEDTKEKINEIKDEIDNDKFLDYKLSQMEKVTDTVKYTIEFNLTKNSNGEWEIEPLSDIDLEKLHGIYHD